jgi:hypothetical protein
VAEKAHDADRCIVMDGVPVLLGDALITGAGRQGARRKLHLMSSNFAVGWTGHLIAARMVVEELAREFTGRSVTLEQVRQNLSQHTAEEFGPMTVHLVGWLVDDKPRAFLWKSSSPHEIFEDDEYLDGSGADAFKAHLMGARVAGQERTIWDTINSALYIAGRLHADELTVRFARSQGFGYAYEILYFHEGTFHPLTNVLYVVGEFRFNRDGKFADAKLGDQLMMVRDLADVVLVTRQNNALDRTDFEIISPLQGVSKSRIAEIGRQVKARQFLITARAEYGCLVALFTSPDFTEPQVITMPFRPNEERSIIRLKDDGDMLRFQFNERAFELAYRAVRENSP